jgi:hypothetical protein
VVLTHVAHSPEPGSPLVDGEIPTAEPRQRQQLFQLIVALFDEEAPQLLEGGIVGVVLEDALHHVLVRGIVQLLGRDLDIELAGLGDHKADLLQADVQLRPRLRHPNSSLCPLAVDPSHAGLAPFQR